jgi:hypothetical protein
MFLDGELRRIEAAKQGLVTRLELSRRLVRIEVLTARIAGRRLVSDAAVGMALARRLLAWFGRR